MFLGNKSRMEIPPAHPQAWFAADIQVGSI